jgi:eukaryotic-like serine/threonine-protein kinase
MALRPGIRIGPYEIGAQIGVGGMGEVYRATDTNLKRAVAVKVLPPSVSTDPARLARFQREAEVLAALNNRNIATIYGLERAAGMTALIMELVEGPTFLDRIAQGPIRIDEALPIASQIAEALEAAHEQGIIHRDLKPANIKVRIDGSVKVLDFGLAKVMEPAAAIASDDSQATSVATVATTQVGMILGTPAYMSPEQARGKPVDKRSDIWAFGCILYEALTGRRAFDGEAVTDILAAICERDPDWKALPPATPAYVVHLLQRCLEKDVKSRLRDIGEARIELDISRRRGNPGESVTARASLPRTWRSLVVVIALISAAVIGTLAIEWLAADRSASNVKPFREPMVLTRATADDGVTVGPTLSSDGTLLAYASDRVGMDNLDIWVQQRTGSTPIQLTHDAVDEFEPTFSPDGSRIAYRSERDGGGIYIMPALGGQEARLLVPGGRRPRFSPDGLFIAYWAGTNVGFAADPGSYRTFIIPAGGGTAREITGFTGARYPVWAPDGQSLLLSGSRDATPHATTYDWWRVPLDESAPIRVGVNELLRRAGVAFDSGDVQPSDWHDDRVLFSDDSYLWSVRLDPSTTTASNVERLTFGTNRDTHATAAASGIIAFSSVSLSNSVWALPIDPVRGVVTGVPRRLTAGVGIDSRPSATRDGQLVAYLSAVPRPTVLVRNLKTHSIVDVGVRGSAFGPAISPDGTYVAYEEDDGVLAVPTRGGPPRKLCKPCQIGDWAAESRALVVVKRENNAGRLTWIDVGNGSTRDLIVSPDQSVTRPFPSPDGRMLAFRKTAAGMDAIMIAPLTTAQPAPKTAWIEIVAPETDARPAGWSPDGTLLYFVSGRDGTRCLYAQRLNLTNGTPVGDPFVVRHFHGGRNAFRGGLGNVLSTGPTNAISGGFFFYDLSAVSANIWTISSH